MNESCKMVFWTFVIITVGSVRCQNLRDGLADFNNKLLQNLESTSDSNFVVSPYSIHSVFTGLLVGSRGRTRQELEQMLGVNGGVNTVNGYQEITRGLGAGESKVQVANLMALASGFKPKLNYRQTLQDAFGNDIKELNFGNGQASAREISGYVADKTVGKIDELLSPDEIDPLTRMILVNAVYFKGDWKKPFNQEDTFTNQFSSPDGLVDTQFMSLEADLHLLEDADRQLEILELPYKDESKSMIFVLPKAGSSTTDLTSRLNGLDLSRLRTLSAQKTVVTIPRFTMKYQTPLKEKIETLGAPTVFSEGADLSGISNEPLYASDAVHQAFIEVNEVGTEAAAATAIQVGFRRAQKKKQFFADRPFLFLVHDFDQDVTLFAGKVVNPSSSVIINRSAAIQVPQQGNSIASEGASKVNKAGPCAKYLRDFPNSLDNFKVCRRVAEEGQFLDWLRSNRQLCEESQDIFTNFTSRNCGRVWCDKIANIKTKPNQTKSDIWSKDIRDRCGPNQLEADKQFCKNTQNKINAKIHLNNCQV